MVVKIGDEIGQDYCGVPAPAKLPKKPGLRILKLFSTAMPERCQRHYHDFLAASLVAEQRRMQGVIPGILNRVALAV